MDTDRELQLEVVQEINWDLGVNAANIGLTVEDGVITLNDKVKALFEKMACGSVDQRESVKSYPRPQYIVGLLVIYRRETDISLPEPVRSVIAESSTGAPIAPTQDAAEIFLSTRETEVLSLIAAGQSNQEIGEQLCLALNTVKRHVYNIYAKLDVKKRTQAVSRARRLGLIA
jgi:DNA-binding CsgD family transcriptional regulator